MQQILTLFRPKRILLLLALGIISIILWNTYQFFKAFQKQEEVKMEILANAYRDFNKADENDDLSLLIKIIENNQSIPMIVMDDSDEILITQNIDFKAKNKDRVLAAQLQNMKSLQPPIEIDLAEGKKQYIYYAHSKILENLKFYPLLFIVILLVFLYVIYVLLNTDSIAQKNKLWSGMAKETAHQIGTPLSSLLGWVEILRAENVEPSYVDEIEKDVAHLNIIAQRFSKIGSIPEKNVENIPAIIENTIDYFKARSSKSIIFNFEKPIEKIQLNVNKDLFTWVLENLFKNAIDAMQGKGNINVTLISEVSEIQILIEDGGKGIPRRFHKKIFEPGYTTKTRGWGLGLSLTKRIIKDYHKGRIFVKSSKKDIGTIFQINIPKA